MEVIEAGDSPVLCPKVILASGPCCRPDLTNITGTRWGALQAVTTYVDHVQPTRATAGRSHQEARFERATEPAALKDRAVALLTEGGNQS